MSLKNLVLELEEKFCPELLLDHLYSSEVSALNTAICKSTTNKFVVYQILSEYLWQTRCSSMYSNKFLKKTPSTTQDYVRGQQLFSELLASSLLNISTTDSLSTQINVTFWFITITHYSYLQLIYIQVKSEKGTSK